MRDWWLHLKIKFDALKMYYGLKLAGLTVKFDYDKYNYDKYKEKDDAF